MKSSEKKIRVTKNRSLTRSLQDTFLEKNHWGVKLTSLPAF